MKLSLFLILLLSGWLLVSQSGCFSLGQSEAQPTLYYTLEPVDVLPATEMTYQDTFVVGFERIEVPSYLDRREIVVRTGDNELRYTTRHLWAERPSGSLQRILSMNIERQTAMATEVHSLPWPDHSDPLWVVHLNLESFEGQESPSTQLLLEATWTIQSTEDGSILRQGHYVGTDLDWDKGNYASLAEGLSKGLVNLGRLVAKDLEAVYEGLNN